VGDRYVLEMMRARGAVLGGETSGHMIFHNHHTTGDGIISGLQFLTAMREAGQPASALASLVQLTPQRLINVEVARKPPLEELEPVRRAIRAAEAELADEGRVLVRYSGTQKMCRVMVEGPTEAVTRRLAEDLAQAVRGAIG
jgi:phosphoglucosamine mutase